MMTLCSVSIIVPVYNRAHKLPRLLHTVKSQKFLNWQLILIDDWSTDDSIQIMKDASMEDDRILCVNNIHNKGPSGARNTGLDFAKGKYIAYQDSDDEWSPHHLAVMTEYLENYPEIDVMTANPLRRKEETGDVFHYDELDLSKYEYKRIGSGYLFDKDKIFDYQLEGRIVTTQCIVGKANVLKSVRWNEDLSAAVDIMHNLQLCAKGVSVCHIQDYHAIYWAHDDNLTNVSGAHSPLRMEKVHKSFALYWTTVLNDFALNSQQKDFVKSELSKTLAWHLGYHTYEAQKKYFLAFKCYGKALALSPFDAKYWFSIFKCLPKMILKV